MLTTAANPCAGKADVAVLQLEAVHEETASDFFANFERWGLTTHAYFNQRIREKRGDFFASAPRCGAEMIWTNVEGQPAWNALAEQLYADDPKLLVFNTFQRSGQARWAEQFQKPVWGVVHNPELFAREEGCREMARAGRLDAFVLAPHVGERLKSLVPELSGRIHIHRPYRWFADGADDYPALQEPLRILLPGSVSFRNRDFERLIDHLRHTDLGGQRTFVLDIAGGGPDRAALEAAIAIHGLERLFDLAPLDPQTGFVAHSVYHQRLLNCHAVMPLLPAGRSDYVTTKITGGISAAFGAGRPIIAPAIIATTYGADTIGTPEDRPFDIAHADLSNDRLSDARNSMVRLRNDALAGNRECLSPLLAKHFDFPRSR